MKAEKHKPDDEFLLSFSDLWLICKKGKSQIIFGMIFCALLGCLYTLSKPIEYRVEATFKEKSRSQSGLNKSLSAMFFSGIGDAESEAITLMKSRKLMEHLVKKKGLQAVISSKEASSSVFPIKTMKENLIVEYAYFKKRKNPALPDSIHPLEVQNITFAGETPLPLEILFRTEEDFVVFENKQPIGSGKLNTPFKTDGYEFTLTIKDQTPQSAQEFILTLLPLASTAEDLSKKFTLESDRFDKTLIKLHFKDRDRHKAADLLNDFMGLYQNYLQTEHQRLANTQLTYLEKRQEEMGAQLHALMSSHAKMLSSDVTNTGFADSEKAMDFLASSQASYKQKLMNVDLEISRLEKAKEEGVNSYEKFISKEESNLTSEIRSLKQQADSLDLALRYSSPIDPKALQESFFAQLAQLDEIKTFGNEAKLILASLEQAAFEIPATKLVDNSKFMVHTWYEKLNETQNALQQASENDLSSKKVEWDNCKASFTAYLINLIHLFDVHQRSIEERLAHQQVPQEEFQGINLNIAKELYLDYSREINELQAKVIQDQFILRQIDDPEFEVTSLSAVLGDSVSIEMISKASSLILAIKDRENRSQKEVDRLKTELALQKGFLSTHLVQQIQLLNLHIQHLKEKIQQTQSTLLTLIQEQITILQNHMSEYIADRLSNLKLERSLIKKSIDEIRFDMANLPENWVNEKLIDQQMEINIKMVEELVKLVESKNINNNLEMVLSAPLDTAIAPIHPKSPRILFYALLGTIGGAFLSIGWIFLKSITNGIQATSENLQLAGHHVSGKITKASADVMLDGDLDTLRRLCSFLEPADSAELSEEGKTLLLAKGNGSDYSASLAALMSKKGLRVIVIPLSFNASAESKELPGLLQYLEGKAEEPKILRSHGYDYISAGGFSRFSNELIGSHRFYKFLQNLNQRYDWIIAVTEAPLQSAETEGLLDYFPYAAINIKEELLEELKNYTSASKNGKKVTFIINCEP